MFKIFKKPDNAPEIKAADSRRPHIPEGEICVICSGCKKTLFQNDLKENYYVCYKCGHHYKMGARGRIRMLADADSFN